VTNFIILETKNLVSKSTFSCSDFYWVTFKPKIEAQSRSKTSPCIFLQNLKITRKKKYLYRYTRLKTKNKNLKFHSLIVEFSLLKFLLLLSG